MQEFFLRDVDDIRRKELLSAQYRLIDFCASHDIPLVVLEAEGCGQTLLHLRARIDGRIGTGIPKDRYTHVIRDTPNSNNAFDDPRVIEAFKEYPPGTTLLLTGVNEGMNKKGDSYCIMATVEGATNMGYQVATSPDLIAGARYHKSSEEYYPWYREHTIFGENLEQLLHDLTGNGSHLGDGT